MAILDIMRTRLRSAGTVGISDALMLQVLDLSQKMFNARYKRVLTSADITLDANTLLYDMRVELAASPEGMTIASITVANRTLIKLDDWRELFAYDQSWLTRTAARHEIWTPIGADIFAVYPAMTTNQTATVIYAGQTSVLDTTDDTFDVPAEDQDTVYDLAEAILHLHMRNYPELNAKIKEISDAMKLGFAGTEQ